MSTILTRSWARPFWLLSTVTVLILVAVSAASVKKGAFPVWGDGISQADFDAALDKIVSASFVDEFQPIVQSQCVTSERKPKGLDTLCDGLHKLSSVLLPGAMRCFGYYGNYQCFAVYDSEAKAYAGWKEAAGLLLSTGQWKLDPQGNDILHLSEVERKKLFKADPALRIEFTNALAAGGVTLILSRTDARDRRPSRFRNSVEMTVGQGKLPAILTNRTRDRIVGRLNDKSTDKGFGEKLARLLDASHGGFYKIQGEYNVKSGARPLLLRFFCNQELEWGNCQEPESDSPCQLERGAYSCDIVAGKVFSPKALLYNSREVSAAWLDIFEALINKVKRSTDLTMVPVTDIPCDLCREVEFSGKNSFVSLRSSGRWDGQMTLEITAARPRMPSTLVESGHIGEASGSAANAIDEIRRGAYSPLPPAHEVSNPGATSTALTVKNNTAYALTLYVSGPTDQTITLVPGTNQRIALVAGQYRLAAKVSDPSVLPFYGEQFFSVGDYSEVFYIGIR